ncbi:guanine deaminase [Chelativorans composti]|jgi:guanine deaminase|uniref:Guanine deaminase n=1 Tax=Chelativorans composti TaxID=768533 RepID=A0ABW5DEK6_9HYPH
MPTLIRARLLSFVSEPQAADDHDSYRYEEDGGLLIEDGAIKAFGAFADVQRQAEDGVAVVDHRPHLVLPGFIDSHAHFPQAQIIGSFGEELLDWLNTYTFPAELEFSDEAHARRVAKLFLDELFRHGTTTAALYCSVHPQSAEALFSEAERRNMCVIAGKVMMDRNAPDGLRDTAQQGYDETKALIARWHGKGRLHYAITPRFAITSTYEQMEASKALAGECPDLHIQTHLSENRAEIEFACSLFPEAKDYTDIYERYGLVGPKSLFGHCIHLTDREADALSDAGAVAVFCPTSNFFLGSGLFNYFRYKRRPKSLRIASATDVGAGTNYSMLRTMDEGYKMIALQGEKIPPLLSFWQITRGNAQALGLETRIGTLEPGTDADLVVLDAHATPAMRLRMEKAETLAEELFILQTMGDDRSVVETYVAGKPVKSSLGHG